MNRILSWARRNALAFIALGLFVGTPHYCWAHLYDPLIVPHYTVCYGPLMLSGLLIGLLIGISRYARFAPLRGLVASCASIALSVISLHAATHVDAITATWPTLYTPISSMFIALVGGVTAGYAGCSFSSNASAGSSEMAPTSRKAPSPLFVAVSSYLLCSGFILAVIDSFVIEGNHPYHYVIGAALTVFYLVAVFARVGRWSISARQVLSSFFGLFLALSVLEAYSNYWTISALFDLVPFVLLYGLAALRAVVARREGTRQAALQGAASDTLGSQSAAKFVGRYGLSDKERTAVLLTLEGLTSAETAPVMGVKPVTVRTHLQNAYRKMGVGSMKDLRRLMTECADSESRAACKLSVPPSADDAASAPLRSCRFASVAFAATVALLYLVYYSPLSVDVTDPSMVICGAALGALSWIIWPRPVACRCDRYPRVAIHVELVALVLPVAYLVCRIGIANIDYTLPTPVPDARLQLLGSGALVRISLGLLSALAPRVFPRGSRIIPPALGTGVLAASLICCIPSVSRYLWIAVAGTFLLVVVFASWSLIRSLRPETAGERADDAAVVFSAPGGGSDCFPMTASLCVVACVLGFALMELWGDFAYFIAPYALDSVSHVVFICCLLVLRKTVTPGWGLYALIGALAVWACAGALCTPVIYVGSRSGGIQVAAVLMLALSMAYGQSSRDGNRGQSRSLPLIAACYALGMLFGHFGRDFGVISGIQFDLFSGQRTDFDFTFDSAAFSAGITVISGIACLIAAGAYRVWAQRVRENGSSPSTDMSADVRDVLRSYGLTETEALVLSEIVNGYTSAAIAHKNLLAEGTVKSARYNGYRKLGVHSKKELVAFVSQRK